MSIETVLLAFDIGFRSCEAGTSYSKAKLDFIDTLQKTIKKR